MTGLFVTVAAVVVVATALALAGRWRPDGLPAQPPQHPAPAEPTRFDVVLRGYSMTQVDAEIARLQGLLAAEMPRDDDNPTIEA